MHFGPSNEEKTGQKISHDRHRMKRVLQYGSTTSSRGETAGTGVSHQVNNRVIMYDDCVYLAIRVRPCHAIMVILRRDELRGRLAPKRCRYALG